MSQITEQIHSSEIGDILEKALQGQSPDLNDCIRLLESNDVHLMGLVAGNLIRKKYGKKASFINNIILNYTNVCITDCKFCAFYRQPGHDESYTLSLDQIESRVKTAWEMFGIRQVLMQGGHNTDLGIEYYENAFRLNRVLRKGKMLCIPMDHGISNGPIKGLEDPHSVIYNCEHHGLTSVIINKGILKTLPRPTGVGIFVHFSSSTSLSPSPNRKMLTGSVEEALKLGADGVSLHINIGGKEEPEMLEQLGMISYECHKWHMPLLAMMYPRGENIKNPHDPDIVAHVARIGAECGADIIKTLYTGDIDSFSKVVKSTPVPVVTTLH